MFRIENHVITVGNINLFYRIINSIYFEYDIDQRIPSFLTQNHHQLINR